MYRQALQGTEEVLGRNHPKTLDKVSNLGNLYAEEGRLDDAERMYNRALRGIEDELGSNHPLTLLALEDLSNFYKDQGKLVKVEVCTKQ
ncbi:hypothetical protein EJ04DRAFT_505634 [Polyplosphaeria fusca]|uniref:Kinesin light chain n=1 Tax=Polyplosphaeria fusca TaxID=682080 RepID=A0A9P4UUT2_9PLEO|nr:hypothetical protein EJ04DRAFT_505634 [Polyplosphaeria fusca]